MATAAKAKRSKTTRRTAASTKRILIDSSAALFRERGYDRTTLDDIAAALSITKPALYYHFSSKEEILQECVWEAFESFHSELKLREKPEHSGRQQVETYLRLYLELIVKDVGVSMVLADDRVMSDEGRARYTKLRRQMNRELEDRLKAGIADGTIRLAETKLTTYAIYGMFNWVGHWYPRQNSISVDEIFDRFVNVIFTGIAPH